MDTIDGSFTIHVNGKLVSNDLQDNEPMTQEIFGSDPAIFTLTGGVLECGDRFLGRSINEDNSLLPKRVCWFKKSHFDRAAIRFTGAWPEGNSYKLQLGGT